MGDRERRITERFDVRIDRSARALAQRWSRRSFVARLGTVLVGAGTVPLLPYARAASTETVPELGDPQSCDYWRYCAFSGNLCTCCGGSTTQCPPGTEASPVSWIGTCKNGADDKNYVISYNDCCGKGPCGRCGCHRTEGEKPIYFPAKSSDIVWCFGTKTHSYHCTVALVLGGADSPS